MILARLREATAAVHRELEEEVQIGATLQSPARYRRLLGKFRGFHGPLEERMLALPGWAEAPHAPATRLKAPWLAQDLAALGESGAATACPHLPAVHDLSAAWGCAYVLEGSTLGGRHILRLPRAPGLPVRFFTGYGGESGSRWTEFTTALEGAAEAGEATVAAATETFARLREWLRL